MAVLECKNCGKKIDLDNLTKWKLIKIIRLGWFCKNCNTKYDWMPICDDCVEENEFEKLFGDGE